MTPLPFERLVHADWSTRPQGRWVGRASRVSGRWQVGAPEPVGPIDGFLDTLFAPAAPGPVLAGFDLPIGLPAAYGERTGLVDFPAALDAFGSGDWAAFYEVAADPSEIGLHRPFYPARPGARGATRHRHLASALGVAGIADLRRQCERGTPGDRLASPLFWCLGPSAVGKAALHGWREVVRPALARGAALWPFHVDLDDPLRRDIRGSGRGASPDIAHAPAVVIAETYPADVYGRLGLDFKGRSKTRQLDRRCLCAPLNAWAEARDIALSPGLRAAMAAGFDREHGDDDGFDAIVGLLGMIAVVTGERSPGAPPGEAVRRWEGWILGRQA